MLDDQLRQPSLKVSPQLRLQFAAGGIAIRLRHSWIHMDQSDDFETEVLWLVLVKSSSMTVASRLRTRSLSVPPFRRSSLLVPVQGSCGFNIHYLLVGWQQYFYCLPRKICVHVVLSWYID